MTECFFELTITKTKTLFSKPYLFLVIKLELKLKCSFNNGNYYN